MRVTYPYRRDGFIASLTSFLIIINLLVYIILALMSRDLLVIDYDLLAFFGQLNMAVFHGWYWQLFTSMFVHANLLHLMGNMLFLGIFGLRAESLFGRLRYLFIYFASGLLGGLLTLLMGPYVVSVGASGGIFGLFGANAAYIRSGINQSVAGALVYSLYLLLFNLGRGVNILAHFGGLFVGLITGYIWGRRELHHYDAALSP
ncbi:MAG: rhomboid family intramembrane serine protease [Candidatus Bathyarchaeia archaeon]|nr:rhomboid family intramembrane serine protease [Candidatus Bathyarchaeota archaeon]